MLFWVSAIGTVFFSLMIAINITLYVIYNVTGVILILLESVLVQFICPDPIMRKAHRKWLFGVVSKAVFAVSVTTLTYQLLVYYFSH